MPEYDKNTFSMEYKSDESLPSLYVKCEYVGKAALDGLFLETVLLSSSGSMSQVRLISVAVTCLSFLRCPTVSSSSLGMCTIMASAHCLFKPPLLFSTAHRLTEDEL